ncbi:MAG: RidA family protein [Rhizobiaceae bacterium]
MDRRNISTGSPFERSAGYSRAVAFGDFCFVSGTTGYDYATMAIPESAEAQARNIFATIAAALGEAGFSLADVVRANYIITDPAYQEEVFRVTGEHFGDIRPAATMIVSALIRPEMKVEIEVTAMKRR